MKRSDRMPRTYQPAVNPIVNPHLDSTGRLTFDNAAFAAGVASGPAAYRASWFRFDNGTGETQPLSDTQSTTTTIEAPRGLPTAAGSFVAVDGSVESQAHPAGVRPISPHFRRDGQGWETVGPQQLSDGQAPRSATHSPKH